MAQQASVLLVVSRDRQELYRSLERGFAGMDTHRVIVDRRVGDRRQRREVPGQERRATDRRSHHEALELAALGHAVVYIA
jgi:hypothetical protein